LSVWLEHVPKKLPDFFDQDMLQLFDFERVLIDQMIPFDRDALQGRRAGTGGAPEPKKGRMRGQSRSTTLFPRAALQLIIL
jgi:hypothetical protein